jgi:hypothetical protein
MFKEELKKTHTGLIHRYVHGFYCSDCEYYFWVTNVGLVVRNNRIYFETEDFVVPTCNELIIEDIIE